MMSYMHFGVNSLKKAVVMIALALLIAACNIALAEETVVGNKTDEDILFNNLEWGTGRDEVFAFLQEKFCDIELKETCSEYEYGHIKQVICTYSNKDYGIIGMVGDMEIDEITVWYICEEGKYDYSMYAAQYKSEDYSPFKDMVEMLEYKYGSPYSYYEENSDSMGSTFDIDRFSWINQDETQKLTITRNNNALDFGIFFGKSSITYEKNIEIYYVDTVMSGYLSNHREEFEAQQKEDEMANKDYNGL